MNFTEFMSILNGEYKETAGTTAKNQCVDLANAYIKYVLGFPIIEWTNAVDFPSKAGNNYDWIPNSPTGVPQEGDLVIWGGTYGHIAIFIEGDANKFTSFDENYPTGSPCHVQEHSYYNVKGWLHPNREIIAKPIAKFTDQTLIPAQLTGWQSDLEIQQIRGILGDYLRDRVDLQNNILESEKLKIQIKDLEQKLASVKPVEAPKTADDNVQPVVAPIIQDLINWLKKLVGN